MRGPSLSQVGLNSRINELFHPLADRGLQLGRIAAVRGAYVEVYREGERARAHVAGKVRYRANERGLPFPGDWVAIAKVGSDLVIEEILPRSTILRRKAAGIKTIEQIVAVNVDIAMCVEASIDVNVARLQRYVAVARDSGLLPMVVLSKCDLASDIDTPRFDRSLPGVEVLPTSAVTGEGIKLIVDRVRSGVTAVMLGPSGAGKSTLINVLAGEPVLPTRAVGREGRGRHTSKHRELVPIVGGGVILDTPGMRELGLWHGDKGVDETFADLRQLIESVAVECRFDDCKHDKEPGCAVRAALDQGVIPRADWLSYRKLEKEAARIRFRQHEKRDRDDARSRKRRIGEIEDAESHLPDA